MMEAQLASSRRSCRSTAWPSFRGPPVELEPMVTLRPKGGIRMVIEERARAPKPVRQVETAATLGG